MIAALALNASAAGQFFEKIDAATYTVVAIDSNQTTTFATATAVSQNGYLLSFAHLFTNNQSVQYFDKKTDSLKDVKIELLDFESDIAILKIDFCDNFFEIAGDEQVSDFVLLADKSAMFKQSKSYTNVGFTTFQDDSNIIIRTMIDLKTASGSSVVNNDNGYLIGLFDVAVDNRSAIVKKIPQRIKKIVQ